MLSRLQYSNQFSRISTLISPTEFGGFLFLFPIEINISKNNSKNKKK